MLDIGHAAASPIPAKTDRVLPYPRLVEGPASPAPEPKPALIELDSVSKVFTCRGHHGVAAVAGLDLRIADSSAVLLMGPSGSGKTTLLSLIGCMTRPTAGRIRIEGRDVTRQPEERLAELRRRRIGFVFQKHNLIIGASAIDNVMLPALPLPDVNGDLRDRAAALLERFGVLPRAWDRVEHLSGGEQQRVAIARSLINDPRIIIADEPTAHLDSCDTRRFLDLIYALRSEGRTVVVASHDSLLSESPCFDAVYRLRDGRLAWVAGGR